MRPLSVLQIVATLYINVAEHPARMTLDTRQAALLIGAVVPFTFVVILPTNQALLAPDCDLASPETRALLERWVRLHAVRTALSLAATAAYLVLLSRA